MYGVITVVSQRYPNKFNWLGDASPIDADPCSVNS
jgi:hypothetical protein